MTLQFLEGAGDEDKGEKDGGDAVVGWIDKRPMKGGTLRRWATLAVNSSNTAYPALRGICNVVFQRLIWTHRHRHRVSTVTVEQRILFAFTPARFHHATLDQ